MINTTGNQKEATDQVINNLTKEELQVRLLDAYLTNLNLNRRCQKAEHLAKKWRKRYVALMKPAENFHKYMKEEYHTAHVYRRELWKMKWQTAYRTSFYAIFHSIMVKLKLWNEYSYCKTNRDNKTKKGK